MREPEVVPGPESQVLAAELLPPEAPQAGPVASSAGREQGEQGLGRAAGRGQQWAVAERSWAAGRRPDDAAGGRDRAEAARHRGSPACRYDAPSRADRDAAHCDEDGGVSEGLTRGTDEVGLGRDNGLGESSGRLGPAWQLADARASGHDGGGGEATGCGHRSGVQMSTTRPTKSPIGAAKWDAADGHDQAMPGGIQEVHI